MTEIQKSKLTKSELQEIANKNGLDVKGDLTKAELIAMLEDFESTKNLVKQQQEEIEELKSKFEAQEKTEYQIAVNDVGYQYSEYWRKYVWVTSVLPWICAITIIGLIVTYIIFYINTFIVGIPILFWWPFTYNYGRHYGRYMWTWVSILGQIIIVIAEVILCFLIIGLFFIPSIMKLNSAVNMGRADRVMSKSKYK